ncbi:MAG: peptidoglycan-associated lipoprotein Pal [Candidatus Zixiibacteriota bacterium]
MKKLLLFTLLSAFLILMVGCGHKPEPVPEAPVIEEPTPEPEPVKEVIPEPEPEVIPMKDSDFMTIYFDFDKYNLVDKAKKSLDNNAALLKSKREVIIVIEGHCDERGTEKYNLSLGDKRAMSAKDYLLQLGVNPAQIHETVSYGKSKPVDTGHTETAWAKNRRCEFKIYSQ